MRKILISLFAILFIAGCSQQQIVTKKDDLLGGRVGGEWTQKGNHIEPTNSLGSDVLIKGTNKYLNFNSTSGELGYGFRDNSGFMEYKNSGGDWAEIGSGDGGGGGSSIWSTSTPDVILYYNGSKTLVVGDNEIVGDANFQVTGGISTDTLDATTTLTQNFTINGETFTDLTGTGLTNVGGVLTSSGSMVYPDAGIAVSTGSAWDSSLAIGTDIQAWDTHLDSLAGLVPGVEGKMITSNGLEGYQISTVDGVKIYLSLNNVENTALSTWAGSANLTTLGTISSGVWNGTALDFSDYTNATADTGVKFTDDAIGFDCSEVEGTGINCVSEAITLDATGDWTGTFDGQEGTYYTTASNINMNEIGTATYDDVQSFSDGTQSAGVITGGLITDSGSGEVDISALTGIVKTTNSTVGENVFFDLAGATNQALTDESTNFIAVDYNSGTPQFTVNTINTANGHTIFNLGKVYREGTGVDIIDSGLNIYDWQKRVQQHHVEEAALHFTSGAIVGETGTRNISITAGVMYAGLNRIPTDAIDTSVADDFEYYYYNGTAWLESDETQIDNLQYNDVATGLATLSNNRYGVHWVYKGTNGSTYVVYGQSSYTLVGAQAAQPPASLPDHVSEFGVLRAKIIIEKSDTVFTEIESVTDIEFNTTSPSNHNELANIDGGEAGYYGHLTSAQSTVVGNTSGTNSGDVTLAGTRDYITLASQILTIGEIDVSDDTNLAVSGTLLDLTGDTLSVNEGTLTDTKACTYEAGIGIQCITTPGTGDVESVGDCTEGACYDGSSDGGTYARLYDGDSNYTQISPSNTASDITVTMPATTGTLVNTSVSTLSSLVSVGTITTGTWNATPITDAYVNNSQTIAMQDGSTSVNGVAPTVDAAGEFAVDTTSDQFQYYGAAKRVVTYLKASTAVVEALAAADDDMPLGTITSARTITKVGCRCVGTCTTAAQISLEDSAGNAMTHTTPTCATTGAATYQTVSAGGALTAGEGLAFDVDNTPSPETDTYEILFEYTIDAD